MRIITVFIFCLCLTPFISSAQERIIPQSEPQIKLSYAPLVKKVAPAVVNIYTKRTVSTGFRSPFMNDPFFEQFFGGAFGAPMRERVESALGSGVIVASEGLIITNAHVVQDAQEITIVMNDGTEHAAKLILSDEASDLAVLRIESDVKQFPYVTLKPSEALDVGDLVLAIGNPFGVGQTVTSGIVSAQGRSSLDINDYNFFIQTDAAINPGNSGGALVSMDGGVVGINTAIFSRSGGSMGIGFAIPSEMVVSVIAAAVSGQSGDKGIIRPWLGVTTQNVTADIASSLGLERPGGSLISNLHSASPLHDSGVKVGDVVIEVNGNAIQDALEMKFRLATVPIGQVAKIKVLRASETLDFDIKTIAPPDNPPRNQITLKGRHILNGAVVANLNPAVSYELGLKGEESGVVVIDAPRTSFAARAVSVGDIILEINGQAIRKPTDIDEVMDQNTSQGVKLVIKRGGRISRIFMR